MITSKDLGFHYHEMNKALHLSDKDKSANEHIHYHLIEKAKNLLLNSSESISEIAYGLGFEQPQNFSKLFKKKTQMSPLEYRSWN